MDRKQKNKNSADGAQSDGLQKPPQPLFDMPMFASDAFFPYYTEQMRYDPEGSYTGVPADPYEKPVQDADDL